jgi:hypothetical protein
MAISRMQMNRQLYAGGGIMDVTPREKFGLGSSLKKFVRKIIPNEVADIATKAAPFVAPFNPLLAAGMAGIGGFDQSGSISDSLKRGILTYGGGQAARYLGGAGFQQGVNPFAGADFSQGIMSGLGSLGSSPIGTTTGLKLGQYPMFGGPQAVPEGTYLPTDFATEALPLEQATSNLAKATGEVTKRTFTDISKDLFSGDFTKMGNAAKELGGKALKAVYTDKEGSLDKMALAGTIAGVGSYLEARKLAEDAGLVDEGEEYTEEMYNADKQVYADKYAKYLTPEAFGLKDGGRIGYANGSGISSIKLEDKDYNFMDLIDKEGEEDYYIKKAEELDRKYNPQNYTQILPKEKPMDQYMLNEIMSERGMNTLSEETRDEAMKMYAERAFKKGQISEAEYNEIMGYKKGGRVGYKDAGFTTIEDLGIEREEIEPKFEYNLEDFNLLQEMPKVMVMDKEGKTRIVPENVAERLGLNVIMDSFDTEQILRSENKAKGGRVGYKIGSKPKEDEEGIMSVKMEMEDEDKENMMMADAPGITFTTSEKSYLFKTLAGQGGSDRSFTMPQLYGILNNPNTPTNIGDAKALKAFLKMKGFKTGGRVQYAMGSPEQNAMAASEVSGIPLNINPAGATELDMRDTGGFVPPVGVKEKADDIPAMLSNNEFVFTAKSVKEMGDGDVNKGAQRMYAMMKKLENGGRV